MAKPRNQSVIEAFAMLKSFKHAEEWVTSSELSRRAKLPEASGYRLVQALEDLGSTTRGASRASMIISRTRRCLMSK